MGDPAPSPSQDPPGTSFADPELESAFGLDNDSDWIDRARQAEEPAPSLGRLGQYQLLEEIGRGGQGVVYKAVQPGTGRVIAIKCFPPSATLKSRTRDRFTQEVQALVRLHHPSIVTVHGAEVINGSPVLLMEYIEGSPIDRWSDGADPARRTRSEVLTAFTHICDAVSHAHQRGVIHRDLKPSNVLVDQSGLPRILDFGIARLVGDLQPAGATITGFAGTPSYASPEQLEASPETDTRSDVYSLGVLLYRLLVGVEPFAKNLSLPAILTAIRSGSVRRPSAVDPAFPRELDWVVLKAMSTDPSLRYQTVDAIAADIRRFLRGEPVTAHPPSKVYTLTKFVRRHAVACASVLVALVLILSLTGVSIAQATRLSTQNRDLSRAIKEESLARLAADAERSRASAQAESQRRVLDATAAIIEKIIARANRVAQVDSRELFSIIDSDFAKLAEPQHPEASVQYHSMRARVANYARRPDQAIASWTSAIGAAHQLDNADPDLLASLHQKRAGALLGQRRFAESMDDLKIAAASSDPQIRYGVLYSIVQVHLGTGDLASAESGISQLLDVAGHNVARRANALQLASRVARASGNLQLAADRLVAALAVWKDAGRGTTLDSATQRVMLAELYLLLGNAKDAEVVATEAASIRLKSGGPMHIRTEQAILPQAEALARLGRHAEAVAALEIIYPRIQTVHPRNSDHLARFRFKLAAAYLGMGETVQFRRTLALAISRGAQDDPSDPELSADIAACQTVLAVSGFQVNPALAEPLERLAWLVGATPSKAAADTPDGLDFSIDPGTTDPGL